MDASLLKKSERMKIMAKENAILKDVDILNEEFTESFDFDELEEKLQSQLEEELADMQFLAEEKEKIGSPENLGDVIMDVVWEQFLNQIAVTAGEDFIKENRDLHLDLRNEAHILSAENFEQGKMPTHNPNKDTYQKRYNEYRDDFRTDPNMEVKMNKNMRYNEDTKTYERYDTKTDSWIGKTRYNEETKVWEDWDSRAGNWKKKLASGARDKFDTRTDDQKGTAAVAKDHTISVAEQICDTEAAAFVERETRKEFAKSDANLNDLDARANSSKNDLTMDEWLNSEKNGQKPSERFDIDEDDLRKKDAEAREEYEKMKEEGKKKTIAEGKKSQKEEAFRIGRKTLRAVLMQLLAELVREIIAKLVKWFKSAKKALDTLLDSLKEAIHSFIGKMKTHLINAGNTVFTTVATAIIGPVFGTIKKVWMMLKQGWSSLKNAVKYIKDPANKGKPVGILLMEVGKIIIAGLTGAGALILGEVIEKGLMTIPIFAFEIPLLGSLANILGVFFGAVVAGIIGAIAINLLDKLISKKQKEEVQAATIEKGNQVIAKQHQIQIVSEVLLERDKENAQSNIWGRHQEAASIMRDAYGNIMEDFVEDFSQSAYASVIDEEAVFANKKIDKISKDLDDLLGELR